MAPVASLYLIVILRAVSPAVSDTTVIVAFAVICESAGRRVASMAPPEEATSSCGRPALPYTRSSEERIDMWVPPLPWPFLAYGYSRPWALFPGQEGLNVFAGVWVEHHEPAIGGIPGLCIGHSLGLAGAFPIRHHFSNKLHRHAYGPGLPYLRTCNPPLPMVRVRVQVV